MGSVEASVIISMPPQEVLEAFTKQEHLAAWWGVGKSLIDLRNGGPYTLVWQTGEGCIDYVSMGVIAEYLPACQLKIEKLVYINPSRPVLGPMELLILTTPLEDNTTELTVIQAGYQEGPDWDWLYDAVDKAWPEVLKQIRTYLHSIHIQ